MQKKNIIELSITVVLTLILLFIADNTIRRSAKRTKFLKVKTATTALGEDKDYHITQKSSKADKARDREFFNTLENETRNLELKRDPFVSGSVISAEMSSSDLCLMGIVWDNEKPMAIISGNIVGRGDKIGENIVIDIKREGIVLNDGTHDFELKVGQSKD